MMFNKGPGFVPSVWETAQKKNTGRIKMKGIDDKTNIGRKKNRKRKKESPSKRDKKAKKSPVEELADDSQDAMVVKQEAIEINQNLVKDTTESKQDCIDDVIESKDELIQNPVVEIKQEPIVEQMILDTAEPQYWEFNSYEDMIDFMHTSEANKNTSLDHHIEPFVMYNKPTDGMKEDWCSKYHPKAIREDFVADSSSSNKLNPNIAALRDWLAPHQMSPRPAMQRRCFVISGKSGIGKTTLATVLPAELGFNVIVMDILDHIERKDTLYDDIVSLFHVEFQKPTVLVIDQADIIFRDTLKFDLIYEKIQPFTSAFLQNHVENLPDEEGVLVESSRDTEIGKEYRPILLLVVNDPFSKFMNKIKNLKVKDHGGRPGFIKDPKLVKMIQLQSPSNIQIQLRLDHILQSENIVFKNLKDKKDLLSSVLRLAGNNVRKAIIILQYACTKKEEDRRKPFDRKILPSLSAMFFSGTVTDDDVVEQNKVSPEEETVGLLSKLLTEKDAVMGTNRKRLFSLKGSKKDRRALFHLPFEKVDIVKQPTTVMKEMCSKSYNEELQKRENVEALRRTALRESEKWIPVYNDRVPKIIEPDLEPPKDRIIPLCKVSSAKTLLNKIHSTSQIFGMLNQTPPLNNVTIPPRSTLYQDFTNRSVILERFSDNNFAKSWMRTKMLNRLAESCNDENANPNPYLGKYFQFTEPVDDKTKKRFEKAQVYRKWELMSDLWCEGDMYDKACFSSRDELSDSISRFYNLEAPTLIFKAPDQAHRINFNYNISVKDEKVISDLESVDLLITKTKTYEKNGKTTTKTYHCANEWKSIVRDISLFSGEYKISRPPNDALIFLEDMSPSSSLWFFKANYAPYVLKYLQRFQKEWGNVNNLRDMLPDNLLTATVGRSNAYRLVNNIASRYWSLGNSQDNEEEVEIPDVKTALSKQNKSDSQKSQDEIHNRTMSPIVCDQILDIDSEKPYVSIYTSIEQEMTILHQRAVLHLLTMGFTEEMIVYFLKIDMNHRDYSSFRNPTWQQYSFKFMESLETIANRFRRAYK